MVTFFAGPSFSMRSPLRECRAQTPRYDKAFCSRAQPSRDYTQPHGNESDDDTEKHIQKGRQDFAILNDTKGFVLERGKSGVRADKSYRNQIAPVRIPVRLLGQYSDDETDEERTCAVDDERSVGEARTELGAHVAAQPEARDRSEEAADSNHQVLVHRTSRSFRSCSSPRRAEAHCNRASTGAHAVDRQAIHIQGSIFRGS